MESHNTHVSEPPASPPTSSPSPVPQPHETGLPIGNFKSQIPNGEIGTPIQNPKSKIPNKKKRHYTVSDKVRAAGRLNLQKARAVAKEILYRYTEKRFAATFNNLERAHEVNRSGKGPYRPACFSHGLTAVDLRRSAPLCGETVEEINAHLARVGRAFGVDLSQWKQVNGGWRPPVLNRATRLAQGLGESLWRWQRGNRVEGRSEKLKVIMLLGEAQEEVKKLGYLDEKEAVRLARELYRVLGAGYLPLIVAHGRRRHRQEMLTRDLLEALGGAGPSFEFLAHRRPSHYRLEERPLASLGNPLLGVGQLRRREERQAQAPEPMSREDWKAWRVKSEWESRRKERKGRRRFMDYDLLREAERLGLDPELYNWEKHWALCEAVFGKLGEGSGKTGAGANPEGRSLMLAAAQAIWDRLQVFERQGREGRRRMEEILEATNLDRREKGKRLLGLLMSDKEVFEAAKQGGQAVQAALHALLKGAYGETPEVATLEPRQQEPRTPSWVVGALLENRVQRPLGGRDLLDLIDAHRRRKPPP